MRCEARKREERRTGAWNFCGLRVFLELAFGWYGDWLLRTCCLAETLLADCSFSRSAALQHASGLRVLANGVLRSEIRSLGGLVAVRFDAISFSESGGFPLFLLGFAACCLWNRVGRSRDSGDLSSLPRFLRLNKSVLGISHVSKSSFDEIALECFLFRVGVRGWSEAGKNARAINGVMSFCWFSVAALCFISVICVTFSMSEKHFSQSMGGGPEWKGCWWLTGLLEVCRVMRLLGFLFAFLVFSRRERRSWVVGGLGEWSRHDVWFGFPCGRLPSCFAEQLFMAST